jgi:hypothetical protein
MPKKEMDYSKTIIYKIVCNDLNITECYVGHTTNFIKRKWKHQYSCNTETHNAYNLKIYQFIRANGGWDNWSMIEIEKYPCNDINEATARERHWYEQLNSKLNTCCPGRTKKEYCETNKEQIKEYYETNKEQLLEKAKQYRETNKEQINEKQKQKFDCECGGRYILCHKLRHLNSKKHKDYLNSKVDEC